MKLLEATLILLATTLGIASGIATGLLPGLHVNMAAAIVAALFYSENEPIERTATAAFILAMSVSHVFHEAIPSTFLGFSESETALAVLPGQKLLKKGQGRKAVLLSSLGALAGVFGIIALCPLLLLILKPVFQATKNFIPLILAGVLGLHFLKSEKRRILDLTVLALAGTFGIITLDLMAIKEPLLPMFSGLFGMSSLISALITKSTIPTQKEKAQISIKKTSKAARIFGLGTISSILMSLYPALGPAQAAMISTSTMKKLKPTAYIFLIGTISSTSMLLGILTLYSFDKARNGSIAVIGNIIALTPQHLVTLMAVSAVAASTSFATTNLISRPFAKAVKAINYGLLNKLMIAFITFMVLLISGFPGVLVLFTAAAIGLIPAFGKSSRQMLMGCLIFPVILYYV